VENRLNGYKEKRFELLVTNSMLCLRGRWWK